VLQVATVLLVGVHGVGQLGCLAGCLHVQSAAPHRLHDLLLQGAQLLDVEGSEKGEDS
jgi:hypothetical protein